MNYLQQVIGARYVGGFVVSTRFDDGTEKQIDVSQWFKGPVFEPLKDRKLFRKFFIEGGTLAWPNGVDIAPEALYAAVTQQRKSATKGRSGDGKHAAHPERLRRPVFESTTSRDLVSEEKMMKRRAHTKLIHEGQYAAEIDVELIDTDNGWSPYLSLEDAQKLD